MTRGPRPHARSSQVGERVAVTGIGAITPIGSGRCGLWAGVRSGHSAVRRLARFDASPFRSRIAAEVVDFDPHAYLDPKTARRLDRFSQFSLVAARMALEDARLQLTDDLRDETGCCIGSALGGVAYGEEQHERYVREGVRGVSPMLALAVFGGASSCNVAIDLGIHGPVVSNANSCASGAIAIGEAFRLIRSGAVPVMLAGGVEAPLAPLTFGAFSIIRAMSTRNDEPESASRPFDRDRDGFVMAEGAAVLVLEAWSHAERRGAEILGEVAGYATTNDAYHMTAPLPSGAQAARAVRLALDEAALDPSEIDYVNAHGSSTPLNDSTETRVIRDVFGTRADRLPVSATKAIHGHALGATGAFEAAICCLALTHGWIPPTRHLDNPDPECDLDYVPNVGRSARLRNVVSNSFGFGGINASLVLRAA